MQVGNVVIPKNGTFLRSGNAQYNAAVIISIEPFILVSFQGDMKWSSHKSENFTTNGDATKTVLEKCMKRL